MLGWHWHQLDHMLIICTLLQTNNHAITSSLIFYRLDALPDTQQQFQSTEGKNIRTRTCNIFTRRRSFAEYWKYFVTRFNDVHAFGYNSAGSEWIWMKFGELRVYCLELALTDFGRDPRRSESGRPCGSFFCQVNNARLCRFPVSQFSRNLHAKRGFVTQ